MKKILFAATAAAMLIGCSKDITTDAAIDNGGSDINYYGGIAVEVSAGEATRVTVEGDTASATSSMAWEAGDEITIAYDGKTYVYIAQNAGATSAFAPKDAQNAIAAIDPAQEVAAYYNVASVDAATKTAKFDIAAEQHEGEPSNKLPLYAYDTSAKYADGKLVLKMNPLASIVEFEVKSSGDWHADALTLAPSARAGFEGYTSIAGAKIDPRTGETDITEATASKSAVKVVFGAAKNFNGSANVQVVVGAARFGGVPEAVDGAPAPVYAGGAVVKLYKNGRENFRRTIWKAEEKLVDVSTARKHVYQPLSDILAGHKNGISTADDMKAFADEINNATETFPVGTGFCNEDGVVVLNNDIDLSAYDNWAAVGYNGSGTLNGVEIIFDGVFDGNNNTISGLNIVHRADSHPIEYTDAAGTVQTIYNNSAGLFGAIGGKSQIEHLTVKGTILENYTDPNGTWSYVGGVVAQMFGGALNNCTNETAITVGADSSAKTRIGGIVGRIAATYGDCLVDMCRNSVNQNISFPAFKAQQAVVGGCFGIIADDTEGNSVTVRNCDNNGTITLSESGKDSYVGGIAGYITKANGVTGILENLHNYGKVSGGNTQSAAFCVGGIAGRANYHKLSNCVNDKDADVTFTETGKGIYIGGIAGLTNNGQEDETTVFENCTNNAKVYVGATTAFIGGIIGYLCYKAEVTGCINNGDISLGQSAAQPYVGGIAGKVGVAGTGLMNGILISDCVNNGNVSNETAYTGGWSYAGGVAGALYGGTNVDVSGYGAKVDGCTNNGIVKMTGAKKSKFRSGGVIGLINRATIVNSVHNGVIVIDRTSQVSEHIGGIVGFSEDSKSAIESCNNFGTVCCARKTTYETGAVTGNIYVSLGGILGSGGGAKTTVDNCIAAGDILMAAADCDHEYRGAVSSTPTNGLIISNCKVGGRIGVVAAGSTTFAADETATFALNETEGDAYNWEKWIIGYNRTPTYSNNSFYAGR